MKLFLGFGISLSTLRKNKLRAILTVLGTSVGISIIIGILAVGNGLREFDQRPAGGPGGDSMPRA